MHRAMIDSNSDEYKGEIHLLSTSISININNNMPTYSYILTEGEKSFKFLKFHFNYVRYLEVSEAQ